MKIRNEKKYRINKMEIVISSKKNNPKEKLIEELSDLEHKQWGHWTKYMLDNLTEENKKNWKRQINTKYIDLSEEQKDMNREWAEKVLKIVLKYCEIK